MKRVMMMVAAFCCAAVFAEEVVEEVEGDEEEEVQKKYPLERYQGIITRQMFGEPPEGYDPSKPPDVRSGKNLSSREEKELAKEQEKLKSSIHFSVINVSPSGEVYVGFTDGSDPKALRHYYLKVGEARDNWTVKEADAAAKKMTIVNTEGIEVALTLGGNSAMMAGATSRGKAGRSANNSMKTRTLGDMFSTLPQANSQDEVVMKNSLRERRKAKRELEKLSDAKKAEIERQREEARLEQERKEAEEKALRDRENENSKRELAEMRHALDKLRADQEAAKNAPKTLEANGGEHSAENGDAEGSEE